MNAEKARRFGTVISRLIEGENISGAQANEMFREVLLNEQPEMQQGAFLAALKAKGETPEEMAGSWQAIYDLDTVKVKPEVSEPLVDNCGTGMDTFKTFNISTAASIIAAAGGVKMAKHGARAITSCCGTVDILETLGIDVECDPEIVKRSIERAGIGIFNGMSPKVHPRALARILSQIFFGTTLNIAASLANPALPRYGVRGVYAKEMVEPVALVMREIGYRRALVVHGLVDHGSQGMDEASTVGETFIAELQENGKIKKYFIAPEDLGIPRGKKSSLVPLRNRRNEALRLIAVLDGKETGTRSDIVCLNAALVLYLMNVSPTIQDGFKRAKEIIATGGAIEKLKNWVREQNSDPDRGLKKLNRLLNMSARLAQGLSSELAL
ncbi:MAG: anthranilate phosphoribosyltransferase [Bacillota bacterium]|nr:anthranilate phosphoribosyltransferase [Bacillota bacterium]